MTKTTVKHFDTLESAIAEASKPCAPDWQGDRASRRTRDLKFMGTNTFDEAVTLARTGWAEGLKNMVKGVTALAAAPSILRGPSFHLDTGGAYPIAALAAAGDPACMVTLAPMSERMRPIIRIGVSVTASAYYSPKDFHTFGAALVGVIDALESADFRVELTAVAPMSKRDETALFTVKIKEAQDHCDLSKIAFVLCHASFLRRIIFGVIEQNLQESVWSDGYGKPRTPTRAELPDLILLGGLQQFRQGGAELQSPEACYNALLPLISEQLTERFAELPPVTFNRAA